MTQSNGTVFFLEYDVKGITEKQTEYKNLLKIHKKELEKKEISDNEKSILESRIKTCQEEIKRLSDYLKEIPKLIEFANELEQKIYYFNSLNYVEQIKFFDENFNWIIPFNSEKKERVFYYGILKNEVFIYNHSTDQKNGIKPKIKLSILPDTVEKSKVYTEYRTQQLAKENPLEYDIEAIKQNHLETIENNDRAIEYIDRQIEIYNNEKEHWKQREGSFKTFSEGYDSYVEQREINYKKYSFCASNFRITLKGMINAQIVPFLEKQKKLIEAQPLQATQQKTKGLEPAEKLKWKGGQKHLAELFLTLEKNNWIEPIQDGERSAICRNILSLFDISGTKKSNETDEVKSFTEIMKPDTNTKKGEKTYPKVYTERYKEQFSEILKNNKH